MVKKTLTWLSIAAVSSMLIFASTGNATPTSTLTSLQESFFKQNRQLLYSYLKQLVALETSILTRSNQIGAKAVQAEIHRIEEEIRKIPQTSLSAKPAAIAPAPKPAPKPVIKKRDPKTHTSKVEGLAGAANFSKNNIYTFRLADIGAVSTLKFWATGRRSTESTGNVWLVTPSGQRQKITKWKERHFNEPASEISSYKKLKPIIENISKFITKPGTYKVEFEWTGGIDPLVIYRVELTS
ncbi:MAG: hypothetical protein ABFS18_10795 [Thermodesulfobacteriota bacterium]